MKNIFVTWHYTTHGTAYLKHVLSSFYNQGKLPIPKINLEGQEQEVLIHTFDTPLERGFVFDEVVYLTAEQSAFDALSSRRLANKDGILEDEFVKSHGLREVYRAILEDDSIAFDLEKEKRFVEEKFPEKQDSFSKSVWRNIHHYPMEQQVKWLKEISNFKEVYAGKLKVEPLAIKDLRDEKQISEEVSRWARTYMSKHKDAQLVVNVSLGSTETQVVWHVLYEAGQLPKNTRFIKTYDDKQDEASKKFKRFNIKEIPSNLFSSLEDSFKVYETPKSKLRQLVNKKMEVFVKSGFSILLLGERGTGKSRIAKEARSSERTGKFIEANCASFDEDSKAESELFGYKKGSFTGANADKIGLLEEANGGVLFLDEVHHLSKLVQAKLMKALQTDDNNKMSIRKMGGNDEEKVECKLIFATNKSIAELREELLPDFYDRIVQHVVNIPPLRDTRDDRIADWESVWKKMRFSDSSEAPKDSEFINWLRELPLYGNYRDLQKIAIYYNVFTKFDEETKGLIPEETPFEYAKNEFGKYHSPLIKDDVEKSIFDNQKTTKQMIAEYCFRLQEWAVKEFGGRKPAIEHFESLGDTVTDKTFNNWKNRKSIQ